MFRIPQGECQLVVLSLGIVLSLSNFIYCVYKQRSDCFNFFLLFSLCNNQPCQWVQHCPMREQPELGPLVMSRGFPKLEFACFSFCIIMTSASCASHFFLATKILFIKPYFILLNLSEKFYRDGRLRFLKLIAKSICKRK